MEASFRDDLEADSLDLVELIMAFEEEFGGEISDEEAQTLVRGACTSCHGVDRVNDARHSPDRLRVVALDMRQRGAKLSDEDLERLVEWLGRVKGTNPNQ